MLNGRNWWTDKATEYEYKEDLDSRIQEAANIIWEDWFGSEIQDGITGPTHLASAVKQAMQMINNPGIDPKKFL